MKRTKESMIAQQQALKKKDKRTRFDTQFVWTKFPSGSALNTFILFLVLAVVAFVIPVFLPDLGKDLYRNRIVQKVSLFELTNDIFKGQFKGSVHSGDTRPNSDANFWGISILTSNGIPLQYEAETLRVIQQLEAKDFNKNTQDIYHGLAIWKGLVKTLPKSAIDKYYNLLISLTEHHSAFRLNAERSASVSATYYAFQAIKELGKMDEFKKRDDFNSAIHFVASMKDGTSGGFRDSTNVNATVLATWQALHIIAERETKTEVVSKAYEGVDKFIFRCQAKDGGFLNSPIGGGAQELYFSKSNMSTTSQALYILEFLVKNSKLSLSLSDTPAAAHFDAINYLRACLSLQHGVLGSYPSTETNLEATYYFLQLIQEFPNIVYGTPRWVQFSIVSVGIFALVAAIYSFYKPQLFNRFATPALSELKVSALFLTLGAIALQTYPSSAITFYLVYIMHLTIQFYEVQNKSKDNVDGILVIVAAISSFCYVGLVFVLTYVVPLAFANVRVFYVLSSWGAVTTFIVTLISCYMTGLKKIHFYVNAGYLAWVLNTVFTFTYLYSRGEMDLVYRQIVAHGHFPVIFVVLPLLSLVSSYAVSAGGALLYLQRVQQEEDRQDKQKRLEDKKKEKVAALPAPTPVENKRPEALTNS